MKFLIKMSIALAFVFLTPSLLQAQFLKKLKKRVEKAAEETVIRKSEQKAAKKTGQAYDSVFNRPQEKTPKNTQEAESDNTQPPDESNAQGTSTASSPTKSDSPGSAGLEVYRNFDFVPGTKVLMVDDFGNDQLGDFPAAWNTNGTGEIVNFGQEGQWFQLASQAIYVPDLEALPEHYTIEFDLALDKITRQTSSRARLEVRLESHNTFRHADRHVKIELPICQYIAPGIWVRNKTNEGVVVNNPVKKDIRDALNEVAHISIAVNGKRFRLWVNQDKVVDVPRLVPEETPFFKLSPWGLKDEEQMFVSNFKVAEGKPDLRSLLASDGRFSTTGILFESGSSKIKPQSMGVIKEIAKLLQTESSINLRVVGHTDADGDDGYNQRLSLDRARAVKDVLVSGYGISQSRLSPEGKGESEPVADNNTASGKANNRRVEFIKAN